MTTSALQRIKDSGRATVLMKEAAEVIGVDARTVSKAVKDGQLPSIRVGRRVLIPKDKFLKLFEVDE